jgi:two-component system, cell cycle response regulator DivK
MPTILLVEDNEINRDMLARRLRRRGFDVVIAGDGQEGVALTRKLQPDLVLMDMSLPLLDGLSATRTLKQDDATGHIPVVALTAHSIFYDEARAGRAGCDAYETKPVELERLLETIERLIGGAARQSPNG